jgi:hypothetical protein
MKDRIIAKLQVRLDELGALIEELEPCWDRTVLLGCRSELLTTIRIILDEKEEI